MPKENAPTLKTVAIIILNYKTPDLVVDCLQSLEKQIAPGIEVVVVDSASNDGSVEEFEAQIEANRWGTWVRVLCSPVNGGFAAGNDLGIRAIDADAVVSF